MYTEVPRTTTKKQNYRGQPKWNTNNLITSKEAA